MLKRTPTVRYVSGVRGAADATAALRQRPQAPVRPLPGELLNDGRRFVAEDTFRAKADA